MRYWWGWWGWREGQTGRPDTGLPVASSRIGDHPGWWEPQDWDRRAERAYRVRLRTRALRSPRVAPVAAIPISAKATAVRVIAQRTPEASPRLTRHSSRADPNATLAFAVIDASPGDRRILACVRA